jgi:hypothetical protein
MEGTLTAFTECPPVSAVFTVVNRSTRDRAVDWWRVTERIGVLRGRDGPAS